MTCWVRYVALRAGVLMLWQSPPQHTGGALSSAQLDWAPCPEIVSLAQFFAPQAVGLPTRSPSQLICGAASLSVCSLDSICISSILECLFDVSQI